MDKKLKTKWVKALRSGKYQQGSGALKNDRGEYCCLGVLANIQGCSWRTLLDGWDMLVPTKGGKVLAMKGYNYLGKALLQKARLADKTQRKLAGMNDAHKSFAEISDYIEKWL